MHTLTSYIAQWVLRGYVLFSTPLGIILESHSSESLAQNPSVLFIATWPWEIHFPALVCPHWESSLLLIKVHWQYRTMVGTNKITIQTIKIHIHAGSFLSPWQEVGSFGRGHIHWGLAYISLAHRQARGSFSSLVIDVGDSSPLSAGEK